MESDFPKRKNIRLKGYDYSRNGSYFITICSYNRACLFGIMYDGKMVMSQYGIIVANEWKRSVEVRDNVLVDKFIVMPNHFHAILVIGQADRSNMESDHVLTNDMIYELPYDTYLRRPERPYINTALRGTDVNAGHTQSDDVNERANVGLDAERPCINTALRSPSQTVGAIIRGFKSSVTSQINTLRNSPGTPVWQVKYYDHIIRSDQEYYKIRQYIDNNPSGWMKDRFYVV